MEQYISKSALLAEIDRLVNNYDKALDYEAALEDVRDFLDSIEVKKSAEIERDKETCKENCDSLTQEPASEELETFAKRESEAFAEREYEIDYIDRNALGKGYYWGCIDGAKWKEKQFEKNSLAACDRQAEEEAEIERDFVMGIIENEHRQPTFDDAIKYGMRLQKGQMMTNSIEAVVSQVPCSNEIIFYNPSSVDKYSLPQEMNKLGLNKGDKVKLIIIKQD